MEDPGTCFLCLKPGVLTCERCAEPSCSEEHNRLHGYDGYCFPIRMQLRPGAGQSLITTRDVFPSELVLKDEKRPIAPKLGHCFGCLQPITEKFSCSKCGVPYFCSPECLSNPLHSEWECGPISKLALKAFDEKKLYESLLPLRILLLKAQSPLEWNRLQRLEDHRKRRVLEKETWDYFQENVVDYIRKDLFFEDLFTEEEIHRVVGLIRINGIQSEEYRAVYPTMALINNSCRSNCRCIRDHEDDMIIRAQIFMKAGTEIRIGYNSLFTGALERRANFRQTWFFDCECERCSDATECGSNMSALKCPSKDGGLLRPYDWKCDICYWIPYTDKEIKDNEEAILRRISEEEKHFKECKDLIALYESFLLQISALYPPTHILTLKLKSNLISLYGKGPGFYYTEMSDELIRKKIQFCKDFISILEKVDPGDTDWKAATLFESLEARAFLANKNMGNAHPSVIKAEFQNISKEFSDVVRILELERRGSHLEKLKFKAVKSIKMIEEILHYVDYII